MPIYAKPMPEFTIEDILRLVERCEIDDNGCWIISGAKPNDYGRFKKDYLDYQAHRATYAMFKGPVPTDKVVDHQCPGGPNRACVNPQHLALVTNKQNLRNAYTKCSKGHPYVYPNVFEHNGVRKCVACRLASEASAAKRRLVPGGRCSSGHELTWENVYQYRYSKGLNVSCVACIKESMASRPKTFPNLDAAEQRKFWSLVDRSGEACWPWVGYVKAGYGKFQHDGKYHTAHRIALQLEYGRISNHFHVDHLCNNPICCRPDHLEAVAPSENQRRKSLRSKNKGPSHKRPYRRKKQQPQMAAETLRILPPAGVVTVQQLADQRGLDPKQIHRWIDRRGLPSIKRNRLRYIKLDEFDEWLAGRPHIAERLTSSQLELFSP
jgi:hypothetical protein